MDFIDKLREKPIGTKKRIAYVTSAVVTLAIFGVWMTAFHFGIEQKSTDATAAVANSSNTDVNPFSAFWDVISKGWGGLSDNINQIKTGASQAQNLMNSLGTTTSTYATSSQPEEHSLFQYAPPNDVYVVSTSSVNGGGITQ